MRSVSFVEHLKLSVSNNVLHDCISLGDINNDGQNELVVVDSCGNLQIFKGNSTEPIFQLDELGDTTCTEIGDIYGMGRNSILVFTSDGQCSIINIYKSGEDGLKFELKTCFILPNIMNVIIKDIDGDKKLELLTCHSDLCVSAYRWNDKVKNLVLLQRWKLKYPMGNITLHTYEAGKLPTILVSQPGCSYAVLHVNWLKQENGEDKNNESYEEYVQYKPLSSRSRQQNPAISCKIIGDITKAEGKQNGYFSLCTLDGTIKLIEEDKILWSLQVDHHLFAVNKVDVLDDNREEVIMCAWDGQTYIVDHDKNVVRFHFQDNVQAFCSGKYSANGKDNLPCLVYGDFHKQIWLYYNVKLPYLRVTDLLTMANNDTEIQKIFEDRNLTTLEEKQAMVRHCLYHTQSISKEKCMENEKNSPKQS